MRDSDVCSAHAGKGGRPTLINANLSERFMSALGTGVGIKTAAAYAGIGESTAHAWLTRGEHEQAGGKTVEESEFVAFLDGVTRTRANVQVRLAAQLQSAASNAEASGDWRAAAWMLERLAPAEFGKHATVEHQHGGRVGLDLLEGRQPVDVPVETREKIIALLREAEPGTIDSEAQEL